MINKIIKFLEVWRLKKLAKMAEPYSLALRGAFGSTSIVTEVSNETVKEGSFYIKRYFVMHSIKQKVKLKGSEWMAEFCIREEEAVIKKAAQIIRKNPENTDVITSAIVALAKHAFKRPELIPPDCRVRLN